MYITNQSFTTNFLKKNTNSNIFLSLQLTQHSFNYFISTIKTSKLPKLDRCKVKVNKLTEQSCVGSVFCVGAGVCVGVWISLHHGLLTPFIHLNSIRNLFPKQFSYLIFHRQINFVYPPINGFISYVFLISHNALLEKSILQQLQIENATKLNYENQPIQNIA